MIAMFLPHAKPMLGLLWVLALALGVGVAQLRGVAAAARLGLGWVSSAPGRALLASMAGDAQTKVVTDIDDTVISSGGHKVFGIPLGGIDNLYERGQIYPGVLQFSLELSKATSRLPLSVAVLTARARELKFALAMRANGKLNRAYQRIAAQNGYGEWGIGEVYYGSIAEWVLHNRKGRRKFLNFKTMLRSDDSVQRAALPCKYVILGDTGERDEEAAVRAATQFPDRIRAIFLHHVYDYKKALRGLAPSAPVDRIVNGVPVFYFRTYIGAALKAHNAQLLSNEAVQRVTRRAMEELLLMEGGQPLTLPLSAALEVRAATSSLLRLKWLELADEAHHCPAARMIVDYRF